MNILKREESLERLADKLTPEQFKNVITQAYSDIYLSVMAEFKSEYAAVLANSELNSDALNKLARAYTEEKIDSGDLLNIAYYANKSAMCERYIGDFLRSIDDGVNHQIASEVFTTVNYENCSYREAMDYVNSGAFYATKFAALSVTDDTARELAEMGVPLRSCRGFNDCYNVKDIDSSIEWGDAVFVQDKELAVKVCELMKNPDWEKFRNSVKDIGDTDNLTGEALSNMYSEYISEDYSNKLYNKVQKEYTDFISALKAEPPDVIIQSAYEIVWKDNITMYCEEYSPTLTEKQFEALLSSRNTLDEVYVQWCKNGEWNGLDDIGAALEDTADRIRVSLDREKELPTHKVEAAPDNKPPQTVKPKHKSR